MTLIHTRDGGRCRAARSTVFLSNSGGEGSRNLKEIAAATFYSCNKCDVTAALLGNRGREGAQL